MVFRRLAELPFALRLHDGDVRAGALGDRLSLLLGQRPLRERLRDAGLPRRAEQLHVESRNLQRHGFRARLHGERLATGPVTAVVGQALNVSNSSQRGATVTAAGGYYYSLCAIPCSQDNYVLWGTMGDAPPGGSSGVSRDDPEPRSRELAVEDQGELHEPERDGVLARSLGRDRHHRERDELLQSVVPHRLGGGPLPEPRLSVRPASVTFLQRYRYPAPYSWSFGDGGSDTSQSPTHTYSGAGNYTVTFTAAGGACNVSYQMAVTGVNPLSVSAFANPNPASVGATVNFTCSASGGSGGYNYTWSGSAFSGVLSGQNVSQSFGSAGTYTAQCNVTDSASQAAGGVVALTVQASGGGSCSSADFHITVDGGPQYGSFTAEVGHDVTFVPNGAYSSWNWSFGDGGSSTEQSPTYSYASPGLFNVSLTANGCTRRTNRHARAAGRGQQLVQHRRLSIYDQSQYLELRPVRMLGASATRSRSFRHPSMTQTFTSWNFGDGSTSTTSAGTHTYAGGGTFTVTLTAGTCTKTKEISISGPVGLSGLFTAKYADNSAFQATQVASGKAVSFLAIDAADTYTWDFGDGTSPVTGQTPTHTYITSGHDTLTYTATLSVTRGTGTSAQNASTTQSSRSFRRPSRRNGSSREWPTSRARSRARSGRPT